MKKYLFIAALALFAGTANAQTDKEAAKALKEAQKAAAKLVKEAKNNFEEGIPNPQYGRKEANFDKLTAAKSFIEQAVANEHNADNAEMYKIATDISAQFYNKYDAAVKANSEDAASKSELIKTSQDLVKYAIKYDELADANPKKKAEEYKKDHTYYQSLACNPLIQCLTTAQSYSTSESQEELALGAQLAETVINGFTKSHLFSDFTNSSLEDWITYAKAFKAQSIAGVKTSAPADVEAAYLELVGTKYEATAYSALSNYFHEKDEAKFVEYLKKGMNSDSEQASNFAFMLMQNQFQSEKYDDCLETVKVIKEKYPDNENTITAYLMEGQIYFSQKKYDQAEALFAEAVAKYPNDDRAITMPAKSAWMKAQSSGDKKDMQHAIELFKQLETNYPSQSDFWGEPLYILYNNVGNIPARDKYKKYYSVK